MMPAAIAGRGFSIRSIFVLTTIVAVVVALIMACGPWLSFALVAACFAFAPFLCALQFNLLAGVPTILKVSVIAFTLFIICISTIVMANAMFGQQATKAVLIGTLAEWPGQIIGIVAIRASRRKSCPAKQDREERL